MKLSMYDIFRAFSRCLPVIIIIIIIIIIITIIINVLKFGFPCWIPLCTLNYCPDSREYS